MLLDGLSSQTVPGSPAAAKTIRLLPEPEVLEREATKKAKIITKAKAARVKAQLSLEVAEAAHLYTKFGRFPQLPLELQIKVISNALRHSHLHVAGDGRVLGDRNSTELTNRRIRELQSVSKDVRSLVSSKIVIYSGCTWQFHTPTAFNNCIAQLPPGDRTLIRSVELFIFHTFHVTDYRNVNKEEINLRHRIGWIRVIKDLPWSVEHIILNLDQGKDRNGKVLGMREKNTGYISKFISITRGHGLEFEIRGVRKDAEDLVAILASIPSLLFTKKP